MPRHLEHKNSRKLSAKIEIQQIHFPPDSLPSVEKAISHQFSAVSEKR